MRTYFAIEKTYEDPAKAILDICNQLTAAIRQASRVDPYGGGDANHQILGIIASKVISQDIVRVKVAECGLTFVDGSYRHDPIVS